MQRIVRIDNLLNPLVDRLVQLRSDPPYPEGPLFRVAAVAAAPEVVEGAPGDLPSTRWAVLAEDEAGNLVTLDAMELRMWSPSVARRTGTQTGGEE